MSATLTLKEPGFHIKNFDVFDLPIPVEVSSGTLCLPRLKLGKVLRVLTDDDVVYQVHVNGQLTSPMGHQATCVRVEKWSGQSWSELGLYTASLIRIGDRMVMIPSYPWSADIVSLPVKSITIEPRDC